MPCDTVEVDRARCIMPSKELAFGIRSVLPSLAIVLLVAVKHWADT